MQVKILDVIASIIGIGVGIVIVCLLFKPFFPEEGDFGESLGLALTPDIIALFMGRWGDHFVASFKLNVWLLMGGAGGYVTYLAVTELAKFLN